MNMKKFVALLCALCAVGTLSAQEKHIFGVRAGLNVSNLTYRIEGVSTSPSSRVSFQAGGSYQYNFLASMPFYLETGLYLSLKGAKESERNSTATTRMTYLQIPVMVNYHWNVSEKVTVVPSAGFYYALGIGGKVKHTERDSNETVKEDIFGTYGIYDRSDFGMRFTASVEFLDHYHAGLGYDVGFLNISKYDPLKVRTGCFFILVGYNF